MIAVNAMVGISILVSSLRHGFAVFNEGPLELGLGETDRVLLS